MAGSPVEAVTQKRAMRLLVSLACAEPDIAVSQGCSAICLAAQRFHISAPAKVCAESGSEAKRPVAESLLVALVVWRGVLVDRFREATPCEDKQFVLLEAALQEAGASLACLRSRVAAIEASVRKATQPDMATASEWADAIFARLGVVLGHAHRQYLGHMLPEVRHRCMCCACAAPVSSASAPQAVAVGVCAALLVQHGIITLKALLPPEVNSTRWVRAVAACEFAREAPRPAWAYQGQPLQDSVALQSMILATGCPAQRISDLTLQALDQLYSWIEASGCLEVGPSRATDGATRGPGATTKHRRRRRIEDFRTQSLSDGVCLRNAAANLNAQHC